MERKVISTVFSFASFNSMDFQTLSVWHGSSNTFYNITFSVWYHKSISNRKQNIYPELWKMLGFKHKLVVSTFYLVPERLRSKVNLG